MRTGTKDQIELVLIRHGETAANKFRRYLGRTDEALSYEGTEQLKKYIKAGIYPPADLLFVSPMLRCVQTAGIIYPQIRPTAVTLWKEMDFGSFEGKNYQDLKNDPEYQKWIDSGGVLSFPGGESRADFVQRCRRGMDFVIGQMENGKENGGFLPRTVGLVVHGGTIMALLSEYYGGNYFDYQVKNGDGYICRMTLENRVPKIIDLIKRLL